jgi:hypothetical protein
MKLKKPLRRLLRKRKIVVQKVWLDKETRKFTLSKNFVSRLFWEMFFALKGGQKAYWWFSISEKHGHIRHTHYRLVEIDKSKKITTGCKL